MKKLVLLLSVLVLTFGLAACGSKNAVDNSSNLIKGIDSYGNTTEEGTLSQFDELNQKESFLGYGFNAMNYSSVNSKTINTTIPIFDYTKFDESGVRLLKINENQSTVESIEDTTIAGFLDKVSASNGVSASISASGKGMGVSGSLEFKTSFNSKNNSKVQVMRNIHS